MKIYSKYIKRILDIIISLCVLAFLSPVYFILIVLVRCFLGKPVFFYQLRPGLKEREFILIKFRSMTEHKASNGSILPDEQRLTCFGKFLRSSSLDELPEFFNILKGEMSLIGPRPLLSEYIPLYNERQKRRHSVRPGLTGLAQVHGRNHLDWEERLEMDVQYTEKVSFYMDFKIILLTIKTVLKRKGISSKTSATMEKFRGTSIKGD